ncbi:AmmeMemoRadiSam system protein A [Terrisporobacter petrolearius]|uniref:AmmeMemoRadiSam system protein A n=1 Tax=Terrisporobacter petrolearius TaxID=1460447 RepID=UPI001D15E9E7|nr:AmmeMemoRadiSam system protein A [Terrisporobacter petrolearius]MCC3863699.1 AmmeMemoRadiSam system protein A [Terrisporobacter petrolearius]
MENILRYYLMPHPPLIIPSVGKGQEREIQNTIDACNQVGEEISKLEPETVVIITPHGTMFSDALAISNEEHIKGDFSQFREFDTYIEGRIDKEFNEVLIDTCNRQNISVAGIDSNILKKFNRKYELDHGAMIPMYFINKYYKKYKIVHVTYAALSHIELYKFGMAIRESAKNLNKKIVLIASGDLSHRLSEDGPYEYSSEGSKFDELLLDNLQKGDVLSIFNMDKYMVECAEECGLKSVFIMLGAMEGEKVRGKLLSYEGPFGVGYGVMAFHNELNNHSNFEQLINMKKELYSKKLSNSNLYVKIARESLNHYYTYGHFIAKPSELPKELSKEKGGVFVSLKKFGNLRGCIGTLLPTTDSIAEEIIKNSVEAAVHDPRFPSVTENELLDIDISVDVLSRPHKSTKEELDPKKYGVIVIQGHKKGLLLPDLEGVDTVDYQLQIACEKAGINPKEEYEIERFQVTRYKEGE